MTSQRHTKQLWTPGGDPGAMIELGQVSDGLPGSDGFSRGISRRDLLALVLAGAAGADLTLVIESMQQPAPPSSLTEAQLSQIQAQNISAAQQEYGAAKAAEDQAVRDSNQCNAAMDQPYNLVDVQFLWGTVHTGQGPVCRNPLYLGGLGRSASSIEQFMQGAYFGTPGLGAPDAPVEIVPSFLQPGQRYVPSDPHATDFVMTGNVRVSSFGVGGYELLVVDEDNNPLVESDGITLMRLCTPLQ